MSRWFGRSTMPCVLAAGAIALAGCGGSSNHSSAYSSSTSGSSGNSGTSSSSSSGNSGTSSTVSGGLPASTPITDPQMRAGFVKGAEAGGASAAAAGRDADCIIKGLPALGVNTAGDLQSQQNSTQVKALSATCAVQSGAKK